MKKILTALFLIGLGSSLYALNFTQINGAVAGLVEPLILSEKLTINIPSDSGPNIELGNDVNNNSTIKWGDDGFETGYNSTGNTYYFSSALGGNQLLLYASGGVAPISKTKAQLLAFSPESAGLIFYCSNCTTDGIVISTGTGVGAFGRISARTTAID